MPADHRPAPEHSSPAVIEDAYDAAKWVIDNYHKFGIDNGKIAVARVFADGNLATVTALITRDRGKGLLKCQVSIYPTMIHIKILQSASNTTHRDTSSPPNPAWFLSRPPGPEDAQALCLPSSHETARPQPS